MLRCDFNACGWALIYRCKGEMRGKAERERQTKMSYVVCMHSLQSFLVRPCFCLSPDIYLYLCCTSCWLCLHDIRPKPYTCPRQRWEKNETNKRGISYHAVEGVHCLRLKKKSTFILGNGAFYNYDPQPCGPFV